MGINNHFFVTSSSGKRIMVIKLPENTGLQYSSEIIRTVCVSFAMHQVRSENPKGSTKDGILLQAIKLLKGKELTEDDFKYGLERSNLEYISEEILGKRSISEEIEIRVEAKKKKKKLNISNESYMVEVFE